MKKNQISNHLILIGSGPLKGTAKCSDIPSFKAIMGHMTWSLPPVKFVKSITHCRREEMLKGHHTKTEQDISQATIKLQKSMLVITGNIWLRRKNK